MITSLPTTADRAAPEMRPAAASQRFIQRWRRMADVAVDLDAAPTGSARARGATALVGVWGYARLIATVAVLPVAAALVGVEALRNTRRVRGLTAQFPALVERLARGEEVPHAGRRGGSMRVGRRPADGRYLITSDLHRGMAGRMDWPGHQNSSKLARAMLAHYGRQGWTLVEAGDVEDFWLTGGSAYGVAYDLARLAANLLPRSLRSVVLPELYRDHLDRVVAHNDATHRVIVEHFGSSRYLRLVGNHDDVYLDDRVVDRLRDHHPGLDMWDALVFEPGDHGESIDSYGVVLHGHQTDPWNLPGRDLLGKAMTWLASAVLDAPFVAFEPGVPDSSESRSLLAGRMRSELTRVNRWLGVNRDLYSMDEVQLHDAWMRHFAGGGPWLVLGHTHVPLFDPVVPRDPFVSEAEGRSWRRYVNSGSGVLSELVTAVEWDGSSGSPAVRLVGWHLGDATDSAHRDVAVATVDGRPVVAIELDRPHGDVLLRARVGQAGEHDSNPGVGELNHEVD